MQTFIKREIVASQVWIATCTKCVRACIKKSHCLSLNMYQGIKLHLKKEKAYPRINGSMLRDIENQKQNWATIISKQNVQNS